MLAVAGELRRARACHDRRRGATRGGHEGDAVGCGEGDGRAVRAPGRVALGHRRRRADLTDEGAGRKVDDHEVAVAREHQLRAVGAEVGLLLARPIDRSVSATESNTRISFVPGPPSRTQVPTTATVRPSGPHTACSGATSGLSGLASSGKGSQQARNVPSGRIPPVQTNSSMLVISPLAPGCWATAAGAAATRPDATSSGTRTSAVRRMRSPTQGSWTGWHRPPRDDGSDARPRMGGQGARETPESPLPQAIVTQCSQMMTQR